MEEGALLKGYIAALETAYNFKIFGYGDFRQEGSGPDDSLFLGEATPGSVQSTIFWQFGSMFGNNYRPFFTKESRTKIFLKGGLYDHLDPENLAAAFLDTDNGVDIDIDMVRISGCSSVTFVATNSRSSGRCKVRNVNARIGTGAGLINNSSHNFAEPSDYGYELVNVQFSGYKPNLGTNIGSIYDEGNDVYEKGGFVRLYNCLTSNEGAVNATVALRSLYNDFVFESYGTNYLCGTANRAIAGDAPIYNSSLGYFTQSSLININGQVMPLSNKPKKSKFQVGETVWYFAAGQLVSGVVKKTKTVVTNYADTADGEQVNLYAIGSADAEMIPESQVYRTRNMAIWKVANSDTRLNTITFNNIDASINFNPDLTAMDLSGWDMTSVPDWTLVRLDGAKLNAGTQLPASVDTLEEMKAIVKSYDPVDSKWKNGNSFGE